MVDVARKKTSHALLQVRWRCSDHDSHGEGERWRIYSGCQAHGGCEQSCWSVVARCPCRAEAATHEGGFAHGTVVATSRCVVENGGGRVTGMKQLRMSADIPASSTRCEDGATMEFLAT
ncbi:hypothetical protein DEO72_LG1g2805 [Vigna unguiculata]|uniref:Uncharacterized protein n=1 Tax=Vigna unguiculata TaxID=3917 RepID=A0A4D6KM74_VIGUN|nr:hypothetical protein DEO72_LG1g2805 [Vigna unguiculata]